MFFTDSWNCIRGDRFRIDAPFESRGVSLGGKNGFYNTWVTRADGLWVLTVNSNRLTTFIDKDRWFRVGGNSKGESRNKNKKSI